MKKVFLAAIILVSSSIDNFSQTICGVVMDANGKIPVALANVISSDTKDSTFISGTVTDSNGKFVIDANGKVIISISHVGYKTKMMAASDNSDLGMILLEADSARLTEIVVKATEKVFQHTNNGIKVNVRNTFLSRLGSSGYLLEKLPLVSKKKNDYVVFGKGKPLIYINDRLIRDNIELKQLNSSEVKSVEIITHPGSEYSATAGAVIKIITSKKPGDGLSGILDVSTDITRMFSYDNNLSLNYRKKGFDLFGTVSVFERRSLENKTMENTLGFLNPVTEVNSSDRQIVEGRRWLYTLGFNEQLSNSQSFGMKYIYSNMPKDYRKNDSYYWANTGNSSGKPVTTDESMAGTATYHYLNAYYLSKIFGKLSMKLDVDYSSGNSNENNRIFKYSGYDDDIIRTQYRDSYTLIAGKLKLDAGIWKGKLSFGGECSRTEDNPEFSVLENIGTTPLIPGKNKSTQDLFSIFVSYKKSIDAFSFELGTRYEKASFEYIDNGSLNETNSKTHEGIYPNIAFSYSGDKFQTSLSFRSTVKRPSYYQLTNNTGFLNEFMYQSGNPYLLPERKDDLTYMFMWKSLYSMISYSFLHNQIIFDNSQYGSKNIILNKPVNIDRSRVLAIACGYSLKVGKLESEIELSMLKQHLKAGVPQSDFNKPVFLAKVQNSLQLPHDFSLLVSLSGNTSGNTDISYYSNKYRIDAGLVKIFMDGNLRFNLMVNDIFNSDCEKWKMNINRITILQRSDLDTRGATFSLTYRFNNTKSKYRGTAASSELGRLSK